MSMLRSLGAPVMDPAQHATRVSSLSHRLLVARAAAKVITVPGGKLWRMLSSALSPGRN
jgi:hypothetical protein